MRCGLEPRTRLLVVAASVLACGTLLGWGPGASTDTCFDRGRNGLWVGRQWFTGFEVRTGRPVSSADVEGLVAHLEAHRIRYVYLRAGPITPAGTLTDAPGRLLAALRTRAPDVVFLPWLSGDTTELPLDDPAWRARLLETLGFLRSRGFPGVHLDLEPVADHHPGYLDLLRQVRDTFDDTFFLSHATRRLAPFGRAVGPLRRHAWSGRFYRDTMRLTDQTVLMGYNSGLRSRRAYVAYMRHQTLRLLRYASAAPGHQVLIGIPAYEHVPHLSDPEVENIGSAVSGVRAALEGSQRGASSFEGVAVYADWLTDEQEWLDYRTCWLSLRPLETAGFSPRGPHAAVSAAPSLRRLQVPPAPPFAAFPPEAPSERPRTLSERH